MDSFFVSQFYNGTICGKFNKGSSKDLQNNHPNIRIGSAYTAEMATEVRANAAGICLDRIIFYGEGDTVPNLETFTLGLKTYMEESAMAGQAPFDKKWACGIMETLVQQRIIKTEVP